MIYFDWLIIILQRCYIFNLRKKNPYHKHNVLYSKDWWLFIYYNLLLFMIDEEVKDFVPINFSEYFKSIKKEQNLRKVAKSLDIFLTIPD